MREQISRVSAVLGDLQRRKVFRLGVIYLAAGWFIIEASHTLLPTFGWGDQVLRVITISVILGFPLSLVLGFFFDLTNTGIEVTPAVRTDASVAVLPLTDMTAAGELRYFCDGLSEEILNALTDIEGLRVAARTSSFAHRDADRDLREVAGALGVASILEGSVRNAGRFFRVTVQLIRAQDGCHLLSRTYTGDLDDPVAFQQDVARSAALAVRDAVLPASDADGAVDGVVDAGQLEQARSLIEVRSAAALEEAQALLESVLEQQPQRADARVMLAEVLVSRSNTEPETDALLAAAAAHAGAALELEPDLAAGHAVLAFSRVLAWDWTGTEHHFVRALVLQDAARTRTWYSIYLAAAGRVQDAIEQAELAVPLDPTSVQARAGLAGLHYYARRFDDAQRVCGDVLEDRPDDVYTLALLGLVHEQLGDMDEARRQLKAGVAAAGAPQPFLTAALARTYAVAGQRVEAERLLRLMDTTGASDTHGFLRAAVHAALSDGDAAFTCLEGAVRARERWLLSLQVHPWMDPLRADPRYADILAGMGWPTAALASRADAPEMTPSVVQPTMKGA